MSDRPLPPDDWFDNDPSKDDPLFYPIDKPLPTAFDSWSPIDREPSDQSGEEYIRRLEEWEDELERCERVPLRQFLGFPTLKPIADLTADEVTTELERILDLMAAHKIYLDTLADVSDAELYRFISEEFLDEKVDNIPNSPMDSHFTYEEYHPNDEYDVSWLSEDIVRTLLYCTSLESREYLNRRDDDEICILPQIEQNLEDERRYYAHCFSKDELYDLQGKPITPEKWQAQLEGFWQRNPTVRKINAETIQATVEGDYAKATVATYWQTTQTNSTQPIAISGVSTVRFKRSQHGGWDVIQLNLCGWHELGNQLL